MRASLDSCEEGRGPEGGLDVVEVVPEVHSGGVVHAREVSRVEVAATAGSAK